MRANSPSWAGTSLRVEKKINNFGILLDSGFSYTILTRRLITKLNPKKYAVMKWHAQGGNINIHPKVKIDLTLPELSATEILTWNCHVDDFTKVRYNMILGRYL